MSSSCLAEGGASSGGSESWIEVMRGVAGTDEASFAESYPPPPKRATGKNARVAARVDDHPTIDDDVGNPVRIRARPLVGRRIAHGDRVEAHDVRSHPRPQKAPIGKAEARRRLRREP